MYYLPFSDRSFLPGGNMPPHLQLNPSRLEELCTSVYLNYLFEEINLIHQLRSYQEKSVLLKHYGIVPDRLVSVLQSNMKLTLRGEEVWWSILLSSRYSSHFIIRYFTRPRAPEHDRHDTAKFTSHRCQNGDRCHLCNNHSWR